MKELHFACNLCRISIHKISLPKERKGAVIKNVTTLKLPQSIKLFLTSHANLSNITYIKVANQLK